MTTPLTHDLAATLRRLATRVQTGRLPQWWVVQLAAAVAPVSRLLAQLDERTEATVPTYRCSVCKCEFQSLVTLAAHGRLEHHRSLDGRRLLRAVR